MKKSAVILLMLFLSAWGYSKNINQCKTADGSMYFSNLPCPDNSYLVDAMKTGHSGSSNIESACSISNPSIRRLMCNRSQIESYVEEHNKLYEQLLGLSSDRRDYGFVRSFGIDTDTEEWFQERNECAYVGCIESFYQQKIAELKAIRTQVDNLHDIADLPGKLSEPVSDRYSIAAASWQIKYAMRIETGMTIIQALQPAVNYKGPMTLVIAFVENAYIAVNGYQGSLQGDTDDYLGMFIVLSDSGEILNSHYFVGNKRLGYGVNPYIEFIHGRSEKVRVGTVSIDYSYGRGKESPVLYIEVDVDGHYVWVQKNALNVYR